MPIPSKNNAIEWLNAQGVNQPEVALQYAGGAPLDALRLQDQISSNDKVINEEKNFAQVIIKLEPLARGEGVEFVSVIDEGKIPEEFIPVIEKTFHDLNKLQEKVKNTIKYTIE